MLDRMEGGEVEVVFQLVSVADCVALVEAARQTAADHFKLVSHSVVQRPQLLKHNLQTKHMISKDCIF